MKKIFALLLSTAMLCTLVSCRENDFISASYKFKSKSDSIFVLNLETNELTVMGDKLVYPASTTKLLTALAALDILSPESLISPGDEVYLVQKGSSSAYVRPHHTLTLEMLIEGMIIPSGNDAAYATAAACGYELSGDKSIGYEEAVEMFVDYMNEYAKRLGCTSTNFTTPDGFAGKEHYSTLDDMAKIAKAASENEIIKKYSSLAADNVVYESGHTNTWVNTNKMLDKNSKYYNENVTGLKTGSLDDSYSLIVLYDDSELELLIGVFGANNDDGRYTDVCSIIDGECKVFYDDDKLA